MLGFFFLTAVEETVSPLARRAAHGWEQHLQHRGLAREYFHPL